MSLRLAAAFTVLVALLSTPAPAPAQSLMYGRTSVSAPERTDAGEWEGTWYYVSRIRRMALWMREEDGELKIRLRLRGQAGKSESFATNWSGTAEYVQAGKPGKFALEIDEKDENTITGRWVWNVGTEESGSTETANFTIYRAGYGRQMVWKLQDFRHEFRGQGSYDTESDEVVWTFQKASRREALWNELPF